ncbi:hypothetical protein EDD99_1513 [Streptomyces sp. 846.5]|nr:hypothetical protein [Streptomyces sp. 846.5]TDU03097.1 hypothetical protein EDD99_1513 [Streptomyces sp. 846.5]
MQGEADDHRVQVSEQVKGTALFAGLHEQLPDEGCRGCAFVMTLTEFPDPGLPTHRQAVAAKTWLRDQLRALAEVESVADPAVLADQLLVILDGATTTAQPFGREGPARQAVALAELALSASTATTTTQAPPSTSPRGRCPSDEPAAG